MQRPLGTRARSLHVGTPAHVYTVPAARSITCARAGNYTTSISIPSVCEQYYETCSQIDRHNRSRQDELGLEKRFEVKEWFMRVNTSLLAI